MVLLKRLEQHSVTSQETDLLLTGAAHSACRHVRVEAVACGLTPRLVAVLLGRAGATLTGHLSTKYAKHV